jgi:hypothetical protein
VQDRVSVRSFTFLLFATGTRVFLGLQWEEVRKNEDDDEKEG